VSVPTLVVLVHLLLEDQQFPVLLPAAWKTTAHTIDDMTQPIYVCMYTKTQQLVTYMYKGRPYISHGQFFALIITDGKRQSTLQSPQYINKHRRFKYPGDTKITENNLQKTKSYVPLQEHLEFKDDSVKLNGAQSVQMCITDVNSAHL